MILTEITPAVLPASSNIASILKELKITNYKINPNGTVDVDGNVDIPVNVVSIPVQFGHVSGNFNCSYAKITSLAGAPQSVGGDFYCSYAKITSLAGAPQSVGREFYCHGTKITSLAGAPQSVGGDFVCNDTNILSLHNIHKTDRSMVIKGRLHIDNLVTNILGLAFIRGINIVMVGNTSFDISHHDPLQFQEQLIDAGLIQQAKL